MTTAWRDLALDLTTGDLVYERGDLRLVQGDDAIAQACRIALLLWRGEYALDVEAGCDWQTLLNRKGVTDAQVIAEVRRVLLTVQGVVAVDSVTVARDSGTRTAAVTATVRADSGALLTVTTAELGVGV